MFWHRTHLFGLELTPSGQESTYFAADSHYLFGKNVQTSSLVSFGVYPHQIVAHTCTRVEHLSFFLGGEVEGVATSKVCVKLWEVFLQCLGMLPSGHFCTSC